MIGSDKEFILLREVASETPYSQAYLNVLVRRRKIEAKKINGKWHISLESLQAYIQRHNNNTDIKQFDFAPIREMVDATPYSHAYLNLLIRRGKIQGKKIGKKWFISKNSLQDYLKSKTQTNSIPEVSLVSTDVLPRQNIEIDVPFPEQTPEQKQNLENVENVLR